MNAQGYNEPRLHLKNEAPGIARCGEGGFSPLHDAALLLIQVSITLVVALIAVTFVVATAGLGGHFLVRPPFNFFLRPNEVTGR